ncbi:MAG: hypothetical protein ACFFCO_13000, partial [Promethearchaeota archaeon]
TGISEQIDILYGMLSAATGLPKTRWIGAQAGDLTASRTNLKLEYGVISRIQAEYDPILRAIVHDLFPGQYREFKIKWKMEYQMDELEKAQVLQVQAGAIQGLMSVLSGEEIRKILGYEGDIPLEETVAGQQQEQRLEATKQLGMGLQAAGGAQGGQPAKTVLPSEPTRADAWNAIKAKRFPEFVAYWEGMDYSRNEIMRRAQIGRSTFYKYMDEQQGEVKRIELRL